MLPDFLIVGAHRSGSTWLWRNMSAHPDIAMADTKEVRFFDHSWKSGVGWYEERFAACPEGSRRGEASPTYLTSTVAPKRMARVVPDAKLLAVLRDPIDRAQSHYSHARERGAIRGSFDEVVGKALRGEQYTEVLTRGEYVVGINRILERYREDQLALLVFDDIATDPQGVLGRAFAHVGVDADFVPPYTERRVNDYQQFRSARVRKLARKLPGPLGSAVGKLNRVDADKEQISAATEARLAEHYEPGIQELESMLGRRLSTWRHTARSA